MFGSYSSILVYYLSNKEFVCRENKCVVGHHQLLAGTVVDMWMGIGYRMLPKPG